MVTLYKQFPILYTHSLYKSNKTTKSSASILKISFPNGDDKIINSFCYWTTSTIMELTGINSKLYLSQ